MKTASLSLRAAVGLALAAAPVDRLQAAVIIQTFAKPLAPNTWGGGPETNFGYTVGGVRYDFAWRHVPLEIDLDGNGTTEFTIVHYRATTQAMQVSLTGRNNVWSLAGGVAGNDFGTHALPLTGGTMLGPSLYSPDPWVGWHNDIDTRGASTLMNAYGFRPVDGFFFPSYPFEQKYMGVRFEREGRIHYGWVSISAYALLGNELFIHSWGWETTPDTPIMVGPVPEPGSALLLLAAAGALMNRRRRPVWPTAASGFPAARKG